MPEDAVGRVKEILEGAWNEYTTDFKTYVGLAAVCFVATLVLGAFMFSIGLNIGFADKNVIKEIFANVLVIPLLALVIYLLIAYLIDTAIFIAAKGDVKGSIWTYISEAVKVFPMRIALYIIYSVIAAVVLIISIIPSFVFSFAFSLGDLGVLAGYAVGLIVVAVGVYIWLRLFWADYYVVISKEDPISALRASWTKTEESIVPAVCTVIAAIIVGVVAMVVSFIPLLGSIITFFVLNPLNRIVYVKGAEKGA